jgi:hypothetical protein
MNKKLEGTLEIAESITRTMQYLAVSAAAILASYYLFGKILKEKKK